MSVNETRRQQNIQSKAADILDIVYGILVLKQAFNTTTTQINSSITLFALDALNGAKKDIIVEFYLAADGAVTNITPSLHKTREGAPVTFTQEVVPAIGALAQPGLATASRYRYELGDLPEGGQLEFRVAQTNDGAATIAIDGVLTYWSKS